MIKYSLEPHAWEYRHKYKHLMKLTTHANDMSLKLIDLTLIQKNKNLTNSSSFHQNFRICGNKLNYF